ncbi:hypothetical protein [Paracidovorax anthurii]|uniref:Uncharacterized protein n=1 Tax=Paracidovorax anthurii TaxID=78229 RepID=A0A328ZJE1_9BURK|nr:hypothetical protein [Paracidovorax anthurii]RAR85465.1 hypothetical protein AX018_100596 [Paracidovorax anthurii]
MSDCHCRHDTLSPDSGHVRNFAVTGFADPAPDGFGALQATLQGVDALQIRACVDAAYDPATQQACFRIPLLGPQRVTLPLPIPPHGPLKACCETCGILPQGLKVTLYLNGVAIFTTTRGACP